jgi:hypothetical protein
MGDASNIQMHDVVAMLQQLQQENANLQNAMEQFQVARAPIHVPAPAANPIPQACQRSLTKIVQNFEILPIKFDLSSVSNHTDMQQKKHKLDSLDHCSPELRYLGFCHYWKRILHFWQTLINSWKNSTEHLEREIKPL